MTNAGAPHGVSRNRWPTVNGAGEIGGNPALKTNVPFVNKKQKRAGTKIFFIGVRTRTYSDFGGGGVHFSADSATRRVIGGV
jgi:hypothetical protein